MADSPENKPYGTGSDVLAQYVRQTFELDDPVLVEIMQRTRAAGLPRIELSLFDGRHLEVLARALQARRIVEIGTLGGFSGVCLARALPEEGGVLHTFEIDPQHAEVARESFRRAGVEHKVRLHVEPAMQGLARIASEAPFDLVFIDADKLGYMDYLHWAGEYLRVGGMVVADNAFAWGLLVESPENLPEEERIVRESMQAFNEALADTRGRFCSTMLPTSEGLAVGVKVR